MGIRINEAAQLDQAGIRYRVRKGRMRLNRSKQRRGAWIDDGLTATGSASRNHKHTRDPHSSLASRSRTPQADALLDALDHDFKAEQWLLRAMCDHVIRIAKQEHWLINKKRCRGLAEIVLHPYLYGYALSLSAAGSKLGVTKDAYRHKWSKMAKKLDHIPKRWAHEAGLKISFDTPHDFGYSSASLAKSD